MAEIKTWDEIQEAMNIPFSEQHGRGYREDFEPGDAVVFPEHPEPLLREREFTVRSVQSDSMTIAGDPGGAQEVPDHRLTMWGMIHSPGHWRTVAQAQAIVANEDFEKGQGGA